MSELVELDTDELVERLRYAREAREYWSSQEREARQLLLNAIGEADGAAVNGVLMVKRVHVKATWGIDGDAVKRRYPDVWYACQKVVRDESDQLRLVKLR
jgi:hypothetical protein